MSAGAGRPLSAGGADCDTLACIVFADELFLGHDLLAWLVLAVGAALVVGNIAAMIRPPADADRTAAPTAMRRRAAIYIGIGAIAAIWALATLLSK